MDSIVLMTDFGSRDHFVGVMKGVIAGIEPALRVIDLTHEIRPQDVAQGAYTLRVAVPYFPAGTVFCVVVDPGVGSSRRAVAVTAGEWRFVLPDNGLLGWLLEEYPVGRAVSLTNTDYHLGRVSATFHGRDIFAPVAAHLARGVALEALGEGIEPGSLAMLSIPKPERRRHGIVGHVIHVDNFGNLITSIPADMLEGRRDWRLHVEVAQPRHVDGISRTFGDVAPGEAVVYVGSDGLVECAIREGNAAATWGAAPGTRITLTPQ